MAFYGESFQLFDGTVLAGAPFDFDDWAFHYDLTHAMTSGDDVIVAGLADPSDPPAFAAYPDPIETRWVLEVAGGSGTLHLSGGTDPDFAYDDPADASQDLGTVTVSGPGTIVTDPIAGVTLADLVAADFPVIVRVECTSGTVDVAQVKLRVWPAAGVSGAWVPYDGDTSTTDSQVEVFSSLGANGPQPFIDTAPTTVPLQGRGHVGDSTGPGDMPYPDPFADDAALDAAVAARAALAGKVGDGAVFGGTVTNSTHEISSSHAEAASTPYQWLPENVFGYRGDAEVHSLPGYMSAIITSAIPNVSYDGPPNPYEVRFEAQAYVRPAGGGADFAREFLGWDPGDMWRVTFSAASAPESRWTLEPATLNQFARGGPYVPDGISAEWGTPYGPYEILVGGDVTVIPAGGTTGSPDQSVTDVPFIDSQHIGIIAQVPGVLSDASSELGLRDFDFLGNPIHAYDYNVEASVYPTATLFRIGFGPVEVWDPLGIPVAPYPDPRFFVKHPYGAITKHDEDGHPVQVDPVGFGIPEGSRVFHVPTAVGMYRDLTKAEYMALAPGERPPGGLPLKVKREDGSWDQVAWMVPE